VDHDIHGFTFGLIWDHRRTMAGASSTNFSDMQTASATRRLYLGQFFRRGGFLSQDCGEKKLTVFRLPYYQNAATKPHLFRGGLPGVTGSVVGTRTALPFGKTPRPLGLTIVLAPAAAGGS